MQYLDQLHRRYRASLGHVGMISVIIGLLTASPALLALFEPVAWSDSHSFIVPGLIIAALGSVLWAANRGFQSYRMSFRDASVVVTIVWLVAVASGGLPFVLGGRLGYLDAAFEAMSGWTTTGLSMVDVEAVPRIYLLWRSIMQFAGGAGLAVLLLASWLGPHTSSYYTAEAREGHLVPNIVGTTRVLLRLYVTYFAAGSILLRLAGMTWFDALNHSMAALSTGGFSTRAASIGFWNDPMIELIIVVLMLLGSTNFATQFALWSRRRARDQELSTGFALLAVGIPLGLWGLLSALNYTPLRALRVAVFETVSALSTTGFSSVSYANWSDFNIFLLVVFMVIGGGTGATAGGVKQFRFITLLRSVYWFLRDQTLPTHAVSHRGAWQVGHLVTVTSEAVQRIAAYAGLYIAVLLSGSVLFMAYGYDMRSALFEFASALGTVGLSLGGTNPGMPAVLKVAQIFAMWFGRLEFVAIFVGVARLVRDVRLAVRAKRED